MFMGKSTFFASQFIKASARIGLVDIFTLDHVGTVADNEGFNIEAHEVAR